MGPTGRHLVVFPLSDSDVASSVVDLDAFLTGDYARVVSAVRRICGTGVDAEDAVQDALVKLMRRGPLDAPIASVPAWVTVVAANGARSTQRRRGTEARALRRVPEVVPAPHDQSIGQIDLDRALAALPDRQRTVATLFYVFDESVATIAASMGISAGTVKTQLSRARASLSVALGHQEGMTA